LSTNIFQRDLKIFIEYSWRPNMADAKHGLGEYVKRVMKLKGLTQKDVQRMSGERITDGYVASITTGRATNLSVDKLIALADGLGVDADELFHVACGQQLDDGGRSRSGPDSLMILETVQKAVMSPAVTQILHEAVRLSPDERAGLLVFIKRLGSIKRKSRRKTKPD
jgi:transcriptional regulator with XRE-family HTH domain